MNTLFTTLIFFFLVSSLSASQVVLVTGASRGIGFAIAKRLCKAGYTVYAGKRTTSTLQHLEPLALEYPENLFMVTLDVTDSACINEAVATVMQKEGRIDILINNAGVEVYGSAENVTIEEAQKMFDVNYFGPMRMCQAVLPIMRAQMSGRVIQIGSRSGFRPLPSLSVYAASKFALEGLSETMAATLKSWNITVSLIEPGPVRTELDFLASYGSALPKELDPYAAIFDKAGILDPYSPIAQEPEEIACIVQDVIESKCPLFRYQTTDAIKDLAALHWVDITGVSHVNEWDPILHP